MTFEVRKKIDLFFSDFVHGITHTYTYYKWRVVFVWHLVCLDWLPRNHAGVIATSKIRPTLNLRLIDKNKGRSWKVVKKRSIKQLRKKSPIRETKHLSNDADSSTDTRVGWTKDTTKPNLILNGKNPPKRKNSNTSRNMPKLAIRPWTRGL